MATLAEQNAVRCKEAGNVLYKSERYEEVSSEQYIYIYMCVCFVCVRVCVSAIFRALFIFLFLSRFDDADFFQNAKSALARL